MLAETTQNPHARKHQQVPAPGRLFPTTAVVNAYVEVRRASISHKKKHLLYRLPLLSPFLSRRFAASGTRLGRTRDKRQEA